jgi:hypothetical protein
MREPLYSRLEVGGGGEREVQDLLDVTSSVRQSDAVCVAL